MNGHSIDTSLRDTTDLAAPSGPKIVACYSPKEWYGANGGNWDGWDVGCSVGYFNYAIGMAEAAVVKRFSKNLPVGLTVEDLRQEVRMKAVEVLKRYRQHKRRFRDRDRCCRSLRRAAINRVIDVVAKWQNDQRKIVFRPTDELSEEVAVDDDGWAAVHDIQSDLEKLSYPIYAQILGMRVEEWTQSDIGERLVMPAKQVSVMEGEATDELRTIRARRSDLEAEPTPARSMADLGRESVSRSARSAIPPSMTTLASFLNLRGDEP